MGSWLLAPSFRLHSKLRDERGQRAVELRIRRAIVTYPVHHNKLFL